MTEGFLPLHVQPANLQTWIFCLALVPRGLKKRLSHCLQQSEVRTVTWIFQQKADVVIAWPDTYFGIINCLGEETIISTDLCNR